MIAGALIAYAVGTTLVIAAEAYSHICSGRPLSPRGFVNVGVMTLGGALIGLAL